MILFYTVFSCFHVLDGGNPWLDKALMVFLYFEALNITSVFSKLKLSERMYALCNFLRMVVHMFGSVHVV